MNGVLLRWVFIGVLFLIIVVYLFPARKADFFEAYSHNDVPVQQLKALMQRPLKTLVVNGTEWHYYAGGNGEQTILFIHGMGGAYTIWWQQIAFFENRYRVIAYTLPDNIRTLQEALQGILEILNAENVDAVNVVGTSMGGYIAQYMVDQVPHRVVKAVFGNTFPPNTMIKAKNSRTAKLIPVIPEIVLQKLGEKQLKEKIIPAANHSELLKAFLPSLPFSKKQFLNRYAVVIDPFFPQPSRYEVKRIPKLIIESANDPLVEEPLREKLKRFYPDAAVFTFPHDGHFPYINAAAKYNEILAQFLEKANPYQEVEAVIHRYFQGRRTANKDVLKQAFYPQARLYTSGSHQPVEIPFKNYLQKVMQDGALTVETRIVDGDITGNVATYKVQFQYSNKSYVDYLSLVHSDGGWKIVSKVFDQLH